MTRRPILLLDVMGTLVREPFFDAVPKFFGMTLPELFAVKDPYSWIEFEYGRIDEETHAKTFFTDGRSFDCEGLKQSLFDAYDWMDGVEPLLARLHRAGYEIHALSNYSPWWRLIESKLHVSRFLEWSFVSCDTGHRKPDGAAYQYAIERLGVRPEQCFFVDDRPGNVAGAVRVGMKAALYTKTSELIRSLVQHGVSEAAD